jgi:hypothetical protein
VKTDTKNNPDGTTTTTTGTTTTPKGTFCADHPGDPNCADVESSFTGSCAAAKCTGDAIQCQIAKEQAVRNCQTLDPAPADDPAVVAATKGIHPSDHPWNTPDEHSLTSGFDKSNLIGGACPADQVVQVSRFRPVTLPFSSLCGPAGMLGNVLVGITALCCLGIVFVRGK